MTCIRIRRIDMSRIATARLTGLFYLVLAVAGIAEFGIIRGQLYVAGDPSATLANLAGHAPLARLGVAADLTGVLAQALAALWFYRLFRDEDRFAAGAIAAFGLVNAVVILVATVFSSAALTVAGSAALAPGGAQAATVQLLYQLNGAAWSLGGLFFGLWLIPMGFTVVTCRLMPALLGWVLMIGGVGYIISTYVAQLLPDAPATLAAALTLAATAGELWMIGYLLVFGIRASGRPERSGDASLAPAVRS
jgi:hypothetical protein